MTAATASRVSVLPLIYIGVAIAGALVLVHFAEKIGALLKKPLDHLTDNLADAYVKATTDPVELVEDTYYVLPNGSTINASLAESAGGANVRYLGVTYKLVEALGNGRYRLAKA
jgi:hypothetical protein